MLLVEFRSARLSMGWSRPTLAKRIGVDPQVIKRLENGVGTVPTLVRAMAALDFRLTGIGPGATLPEQLGARRRRLGVSSAEAASRSGLSRATVAAVERGEGSVASLLRMLDAIAPAARRRAPERSYWGEGVKESRDSRFTPSDFIEHVYAAFGDVDLDPCAHPLSPVVAKRRIIRSEGGDGLTDAWSGTLAFVNPPFSKLLTWLRRAHDQWRGGAVDCVVCLVPVRTDSAWFHEVLSRDADIYLLKGRIRFLDPGGGRQPTPFSLMLLALGSTREQRERFAARVPGYWSRREEAAFASHPHT